MELRLVGLHWGVCWANPQGIAHHPLLASPTPSAFYTLYWTEGGYPDFHPLVLVPTRGESRRGGRGFQHLPGIARECRAKST